MVSHRLKQVMLKELDLDDYDFHDGTTADQVQNWDSLSHINVIVAVEKEFNVKFKGIEILKIKNVGALQQLVDRKLAAA
jgi:acyl carrier protein